MVAIISTIRFGSEAVQLGGQEAIQFDAFFGLLSRL
jgi:hypothetical protein